MKKLFISLATVLVLSMAFTACNKDDNTDPKDDNKGKNEQTDPQTSKINLKVAALYVVSNNQAYDMSKTNITRPDASSGINLPIAVKFTNEGPGALTKNDVVVLKAYINDEPIGGEYELPENLTPALSAGQSSQIIGLLTAAIGGEKCQQESIPICLEVVSVNKTELHNKFTVNLKFTDPK